MKNAQTLPGPETITTTPFPKSKKIYVKGKIHPVEVAMREIETDDAVVHANGKSNGEKVKIAVYDTSGPFTDTAKTIDVKKGLDPLRLSWIKNRGDVDQLSAFSSGY